MLLYIDACVRADSRTRRLADRLEARLRSRGESEVRRVVLDEAGILPLDGKTLEERMRLSEAGDFSGPLFQPAKEFAAADTILIAAPHWDLSFPAALKAYVEAINIIGVTFLYSPEGVATGLCNASRLYYISTAGGPATPPVYGYGYFEAMAKTFWGIPDVYCVQAEGLDVAGADIEGILAAAEKEIAALPI